MLLAVHSKLIHGDVKCATFEIKKHYSCQPVRHSYAYVRDWCVWRTLIGARDVRDVRSRELSVTRTKCDVRSTLDNTFVDTIFAHRRPLHWRNRYVTRTNAHQCAPAWRARTNAHRLTWEFIRQERSIKKPFVTLGKTDKDFIYSCWSYFSIYWFFSDGRFTR